VNDFGELLQDFRDREDHEVALQLLMDHGLLRYCGLWRNTVVTRVHDWPLGTSWNDLWGCVEIDYKRLTELADEPEGRVRYQINRLRELRLIYPDGGRTQMASKAIVKFMTDRLAG
jgi:hypothetical protein